MITWRPTPRLGIRSLEERFWLREIERLETIHRGPEVDGRRPPRTIQTDRLAVVIAGDFVSRTRRRGRDTGLTESVATPG